MAYCSKCGAQVADNSAYCSACGHQQGIPSGSNPGSDPGPSGLQRAHSGLSENVAGLLCYLFGWITGLIFFLIDKRPFVRFHAAQSLVVFGALHIVSAIMGVSLSIHFLSGGWGHWENWAPFGLFFHLLHLAELILWIVLMVKAFQGEKFRVPIASEIADGMAGR